MKRTWYRFMALVLCLAMLLPTGTAFATPKDHSVSDVTVAEGSGSDDYRFPAVVNAGDKLLAVFRNEADSSICLSESTDNGQSWTDPEVVVAGSVGGSSPDLSCLSDGTVLLTYNAAQKAHLMTSDDAGQTWSEAMTLESTILNSFSACSAAAELDDGDILLAVYGKGTGTSTAGGWHADSVALRYTLTASGWEYVSESVIAREADETALAHVGDGVVYALTGESGNVYMSEDEGATWELVAAEEPRVTHEVNSERMHEEQIQHPAFVKVDDDRWFVTFTNLNTDASKPWETQGKIVYGKMFYPASGWDATISRPLYSADGESRPMGSPVATLTNNQKLLTVYYDSAVQSVLGTTSELSDWPDPANESGLDIVKFDFESTTLPQYLKKASGAAIQNGVIDLKPSATGAHNIDVESGQFITGSFVMQYDFMFDENNTTGEMWIMPRNGKNSHKVFLSPSELAIKTGNQGDTSLDEVVDAKENFSLNKNAWYTVKLEKTGSTLRVKVWARGAAEPAEWDVSTTHSTIGQNAAWYIRNYFYGWSANQHMYVDNIRVWKPAVLSLNKTYIEADADQTDNNILDVELWPNENMASEKPAHTITYTSSNASVVKVEPIDGTSRARLTFLKGGTATITASYGNLSAQCKVKVNGALAAKETYVEVVPMQDFSSWQSPAYVQKSGGAAVSGGTLNFAPASGGTHEITVSNSGSKFMTGHFTQQFDFMFDANNSDSGSELRIMPRNEQNGHRIVISPNDFSIVKPSSISADGGTEVTSVEGFSLEKGVWYTVKVEKDGSNLSVKLWERSQGEPAEYDMTVTESAIGHDSGWIIWNYYKASAANQKLYVDNFIVYRKTVMKMDQAAVTGTAGGADKTVSAVFTPEIYGLVPAPGNVTFTSSDPSVVSVEAVSGEAAKAKLTFLKKGTATVTATLGELSATCQVTVKPDPADLTTRWEFFKFDFADWADRPVAKMSKTKVEIASDGTAEMAPDTGYADVSLWRDDSPLYITGRYSFQFDFRFNDDNPDGNAVWFRPYYNNQTSLKVNVTQNSVAFYNGSYGTGCTEGYYPGEDTELKKATFSEPLEDGVWYTVRFEKEDNVMRVKVWARDELEPDGWDAETTDSATRDYADKRVGFFIRYKSGTADQTLSLDNLTMFKDVEMTLPETVEGSLTLPVAELEAVFTPNIANEMPVPDPVVFTSDDESVVAVQSVEGDGTKAALSFLKQGETTIHAVMAGLKAKTTVKVVEDDGKVSSDRWEFLEYDFTDWGSRPISAMTKNGRVDVADGTATMTAGGGTQYATMDLNKSNSSLMITGKYSFQFDFRFNADDAANAIWFRPHYNSQSSLKITVTPEKVTFYEGSYGTGCEKAYYEGEDTLKGEGAFSEPLEDGVWYTVRFEREGSNMYVRVWKRGETEPDDWDATCTDRMTAGKENDPVGFFVRYNAAAGSTADVDNLVMFKQASMTMPETVDGGLNLPFAELQAEFAPNIYAEQPTPPAVNFYTTDSEAVTVTPVEGEPGKATLNFRKTTGGQPVSVIAVMDDYFAKCEVTVVDDNGAVSADRWEFYGYDFDNKDAKPTNLSTEGAVAIEDGVAKLDPATGRAGIYVQRGSGNRITGKHSFQFDFRFDADDTGKSYDEQNAIWFRPYNSSRSETKIAITQNSVAMYREAKDAIQYAYAEGEDEIIMAPVAFEERLTAGTWYTVRVEKDATTFYIKVWERGTEEPDEWLAYGSRTGKSNDVDDLNNPVGFYIRYRGAGVSLDNLSLYKYTQMTMDQTINGGIQNKNPLEVTAKFTPDIYAEYPTPPEVSFYVSDSSVVGISSVDGAANGNKASLSFSRATTDADDITLTAMMEGFFATSKVNVMEISPEPTTEIGDRLELFVDDSLLDFEDEVDGISKDVTLVLHEPVKQEESENPFPRAYYSTVIWDEEYGIYRGYYRADGAWGQVYAYVESTDGINWTKPSLGVHPEYEELYNLPNVVIAPNTPGNIGGFEHNFSPFLDTNPDCDPNERFKAIAGYGGDLGELEEGEVVGLYTLVSPDGIHWTRKSDEPIIVFDEGKHYWAFDSQNAAFWSEEEGKYVMFYRHYNVGLGNKETYRSIGRATSEDFITWVDEIDTFEPLNLDGGTEEIYASQTAPYYRAPHIYIGTATRYALGNLVATNPETGEQYTYEEAKKANLGATDLMLITSRAGNNYYDRYYDEAFLRPGLNVTAWTDRYNYTSLYVVPTGYGEMSFYHYDGTRYTLRTDGFASARAGAEGGELVTKPVSFTGEELLLNYSASVEGSIVVELQDEFGKPYPGFEAENCEPLTGDFIERVVTWKGADVASLIGKSVKIRFIMKDVDLYSYKFGTPEDVVRIEATFNQTGEVYALGRFEQLEPMLKVEAVTSNGSRYELGADAYSLRGSLAVGTQTITAYYGEHSDTFRVNVTSATAVKLTAAFDKAPMDTDTLRFYLDKLLTVTAIYSDGSTSPVHAGAYTVSGSRTIGSTLTITYRDLTTQVRIPETVKVEKQPVLTLPLLDTTYVESTGEYENISDRLELFVDDTLVESLVGEAEIVMHTPQKAADSENPFPRGSYTTVIYDAQEAIYRGYYRIDGRWGQVTGYVESADGINWYKPALGIYPEYDEEYDLQNVIMAPDDPQNLQHFEHNFSPFLDTNPDCDPNERYKAIAGYGSGEELRQGGVGLYLLVSPDGIHWSLKSEEPIFLFDSQKHSYGFDSQNVGFWSEAEQLYVCYFRHYKYSETETSTRTVGRITSADLVTWTQDDDFVSPNVDADEQLYTSQTAPYFRAPHIYISTATRYALGNLVGYDPETAIAENLGATDVMLMSSRAGDSSFTRLFDEAFMRPGLDPANWTDRWNYMSLNLVPTGAAEMSFYHKSGDRYTLRTDGFASVRAGAAGGEVITEPVIFSGRDLLLNYSTSVKGSVVVEIQDVNGNPYPGFEAENCIALSGDSIEEAIKWKNASVATLSGKPVKIRFILKDADLYSYRFGTAKDDSIKGIIALFDQTQPVYALATFESLKPMLTVYARKTDGTVVELAPDAYSLRGSLAVGSQIITVYYGDHTAQFRVEVTSVTVERISVRFIGSGTINYDTPLEDVKDVLEVTAYNNNGTTHTVDRDSYRLTETVFGFTRSLTVEYMGKKAYISFDTTPGQNGAEHPDFSPEESDDETEEPGSSDTPIMPGVPSDPDQPDDPFVPEKPDPDDPVDPEPDDPFYPGGSDDDDPVVPSVSFADVPANAWYHEAVEYVVLKGLMSGMSETEFGPGSTLNRAMVVTVLWRMEGEPAVDYDMSFTDVPAGQWYTEAVRWAASEGIVNGMDAATYAPLNAVTREQLVTILYRYAQNKGYDVSVGEDTNILSYTDAFEISEYAIPAMQWACGAGVINGNDDGSLNPKGKTKRSEFAKVIMNFCENVAE